MFNNTNILRSQQIFKSDYHEVYTEEVDKIALSSNDNKRLETYDGVTTCPYRTNAIKVCENEMENNILKMRFKCAFKECINEISKIKK